MGRAVPRVVAVDEPALGDPGARQLGPELVDAPAVGLGLVGVALHPLELAGRVVAARHPGRRAAPPGRQGQLLAAAQLAGDAATAAGRQAAALRGRRALGVAAAGRRAGRADVLLGVGRTAAHWPGYRVA